MPWTASVPTPSRERLPVQFVHSDAQWEAMTSARRSEILQTILARGPCCVAELARLLDAAQDGVYHHVRVLERAGLVREVEVRKAGKRVERVFDVAADRLRLDVDPALDRNTGRLVRLLRVYCDRALSLLTRSLSARVARIDGPAPDTLVHADIAWLDDDDLSRLTQLFDEINRVFEIGRTRRRGRLVALTLAMSPVVRARSADARRTRRAAEIEAALAQPTRPATRRRARPKQD